MSSQQPNIVLVGRWQENFLFLALLALVPMIGAQFALGNQTEQLSIVARILDPGAMPGDLYVDNAAAFGPRFYYSHMLALFGSAIGIPAAIFALSVVTNFTLGAVSYAAAGRLLGAGPIGCCLAAILAVTNGGFSIGFAGFLHFDSYQPASAAIPLSLIGFLLLAQGRALASVLPFALGALMHPLVGVEIALIAFAASGLSLLLIRPENGFIKPLATMIGAGVIFSILVAAAWILPTLGADKQSIPASEFFDILIAFRAPHHYLGSEFSRLVWQFAILGTAGFGVVFLLRFWLKGFSREALTLAFAAAIVAVLCVASLYFVDMMQDRIWSTAQVFRTTMLLKWAGYLTLAWLLGRWLEKGGLTEIILAIAIVVATQNALSYVLILALVAMAAVTLGRRWFGRFGGQVLEWLMAAAAVVVLAIALYITRRYGSDEHTVRAIVALAAAGLILWPRTGRELGSVIALVLVGAVLVTTTVTRQQGLFGWQPLAASFTWSDIQNDEADIARQAKAETAPDTLWIVPPKFEAFRLFSNRAVVADFTSFPFDDLIMREWRARMEFLYAPGDATGHKAANVMTRNYQEGIDFPAAAAKYGATHAVLFAETPWDGPVLFNNGSYKAVALTP